MKKVCLFCGKDIIERSKRANQFCDNDCHNNYKSQNRIQDYKDGIWDGSTPKGEISLTVSVYIRDFYNNKCQSCGWDKIHRITGKVPLEIHHKDGDSTNNSFENLELLCPNCHSLTDTFRNLNGNGNSKRKYRNKKHEV